MMNKKIASALTVAGLATFGMSSAASADSTYTIKQGDTLSSIAREHSVSVQALVTANQLSNPDMIFAGQQLSLTGNTQGKAGQVKQPSATGTHTIQAGDTLTSIAQQYGVSVQQLVNLNHLSNPSLIFAGEQLIIKGQAVSAPQAEEGGSVAKSQTEKTTSVDKNASSHTIQAGDTLSSIARQYGTTVSHLVALNHLDNAGMIFAGEQLTVRGVTTPQAQAAQPSQPAAQAKPQAQVAQPSQPAAQAKPQAQVAQPSQPAAQAKPQAQVAQPSQPAAQAKPQAQAAQPSQPAAQAKPQAQVAQPSQPAAQAAQPSQPAAQAKPQAQVAQPSQQHTVAPVQTSTGSVYDQFIAAGGTDALWQTVVLPESGGNPNAVSPAGYRGLGQTKQAWGTGSVATQTQGMINYAIERYGSISGAVAYRAAHGWW